MDRVSFDSGACCFPHSDDTRSGAGSEVVAIPALPVVVSISTKTVVSVDVSRVAGLLTSLPSADEFEFRGVTCKVVTK